MSVTSTQLYIERATDFYRGVQVTESNAATRRSSALLAIHSAISYADALRTGLGDDTLYADDHRKAIATLRKLLSTRGRVDQDGLQHLEGLLGKKSAVAYGRKRLDEREVFSIITKAERFAAWASAVGRLMQIEGGPVSNFQRSLGRAKNAVLTYFEQTLYVPKIYLDAEWDGHLMDVLAIDRDGAGDVHIVSLLTGSLPASPQSDWQALSAEIEPIIDQLLPMAAEYKYIAVLNTGLSSPDHLLGIPASLQDRFYDPIGIGRIGFLHVEVLTQSEPRVNLLLKPERFRAKVAGLATQYLLDHVADWEIRA